MDKSNDAAETQEWLDAVNSVQADEGLGRVDNLLSEVVAEARKNGAKLSLFLKSMHSSFSQFHANAFEKASR